MSNPITGFLDSAANAIANAIEHDPVTPTLADIIDKPLPYTPEPEPIRGNITIVEDLVRFTLPSFKSMQTLGFGIGDINGGGSAVLHFLPRTPANGIIVNFPQPSYSIWIDPAWTTPGALIGIGNGSTKSGYRLLGRGEGIRFRYPVSKLTFYNADGLEVIVPEIIAVNQFPWGYLGFLIGLTPEATYDNKLHINGVCNVSKLINGFPIPSSFAPDDKGGFTPPFPVSLLRLQRIGLNFIFTTGFGAPSNFGSGAIVRPWFLSSMPTVLSGGYRSVGDDSDFNPQFGQRWIKGRPISISSIAKNSAIDTTRTAGQTANIAIPNNALALTLSASHLQNQAGDVTGNGVSVFAEVYGYE